MTPDDLFEARWFEHAMGALLLFCLASFALGMLALWIGGLWELWKWVTG